MKEKLSAFVDGELDAEVCDPLVESLRSAPDMRRRWDAYCLIGDALRGDRVGAADFAARVMGAIDDEPTVMVPAAARAVRQRSSWGRSLMPVAASVMGVAAVGLVALTMFPSSPDPVV
ncbi:MAG: sigma-E factor negative regulatory protein, partial [Azoarcus sp.]|nr:sigma-E factor negative regulatory protein [Azoarcus sp.]